MPVEVLSQLSFENQIKAKHGESVLLPRLDRVRLSAPQKIPGGNQVFLFLIHGSGTIFWW